MARRLAANAGLLLLLLLLLLAPAAVWAQNAATADDAPTADGTVAPLKLDLPNIPAKPVRGRRRLAVSVGWRPLSASFAPHEGLEGPPSSRNRTRSRRCGTRSMGT